MKWTKIGKPPEPRSKDSIDSYEYYDDQKIVDREFGIKRPSSGTQDHPNTDKKQSHLWVSYRFDSFIKVERQRDYEIFCGGFLIYHEDNVRFKTIKYRIYFEWSPRRSKGPFYVSIYLSPKPQRTKNLIKSDTQSAVAEAQANADEGDGETVDPPVPPPPPPPPRE